MAIQHTVVLGVNNRRADIEHGSLHFIGTATILLRYAGFTILTDPNFLHLGEHIHLGYGMRAVRQTNPAMNIEALPPLDAVILSHIHEDHFDRLAVKKLQKTVPIITTPQAAQTLKEKGFSCVYPLATWEKLTLAKGESQLHITAMPGKHGPGPLAALLPSVMGSIVEFEPSVGKISMRLYISGDTLMCKQLKEIPQRYPEIDLALLHLGGTRLLGLLLTMDARQGVEALKIINPRQAIPIHYNDYNIFRSSLEEFQKAVEKADLSKRVSYLHQGDTYTFDIPGDRL